MKITNNESLIYIFITNCGIKGVWFTYKPSSRIYTTILFGMYQEHIISFKNYQL